MGGDKKDIRRDGYTAKKVGDKERERERERIQCGRKGSEVRVTMCAIHEYIIKKILRTHDEIRLTSTICMNGGLRYKYKQGNCDDGM